jgi:tRNA dimethylallyltransferase
MNIGTAKPSRSELEEITHHGIDITEPEVAYSAAKFSKDAKQWLKEIEARGHIPLIVGGTMLYWRALAHGLSEMPAASPEIRLKLEQDAAERGWPAIHAELEKVDPIAAARIEMNDSQRIQRALEIYLSTGKSMSAWQNESPTTSGRSNDPISPDIPLNFRLFSIEPSDRSVLHERIAKRFEIMMQEGFLEEMKSLHQNPKLHPDLPSMRAVGYRQFQEQAIAATRQLAKRQLTWLRGIQDKQVIDPLNEDDLKKCEQDILAHYGIREFN